MPTLVKERTKTLHAARTFGRVMAANSKELPTRIEIIRAGEWPDDSNKGFMKITTADLLEYKSNFDKGIGMPGGPGFGLPIDFSHEEWDKAAGWMKELIVEADILYAEVEWTGAGTDSLMNGEFKCISPSFFPSCLGSWHDPEDWSITAQNVLVGAGLTNIPFFKGLKPVMASASEGGGKNIIYVRASAKKGNNMPTLEEVLAKDATELTTEDRGILVEANNAKKLNADQQKQFGFEVTETKTEKKEEPVIADNKIDAAAFSKLQSTVEEQGKVIASQSKIIESYEDKGASEFVDAQIARGAIVADQKDDWVKQVKADANVRVLLEKIPDNKAMASTQGDSKAKDQTGLEDEAALHEKTMKKVNAARDEGKNLEYHTARKQVLDEAKGEK